MEPDDFLDKAATDGAEKGCLRHKKWPYFVSLSPTTNMVSKPLDLGSPSTKLRLISSHTCLGIGNG